ncbi:PhzF family phenazine biosynthesis protein [Arenimonas sp.]|uniref:PhzF family phenazine biosynthesis protein n=1 Tax=Arenimonas sp. TaxID=1872635 RepID=UPI0039E36FFE
MNTHEFLQIDVFAERPGAGNPLAVVFGGERLDDAQMQAIAAWTNLAETTFVLAPTNADADYRVRIFTTRKEIAFAGHPSIGTARAVLETGFAEARDGSLRQECLAGVLPVRVEGPAADPTLSVRVPRSRILRYASGQDEALRRALHGLSLGALPPAIVEGGRRWWLAELADEASVRSMRPDHGAIAALAKDTDSLGLCVFARCANQPFQLVVRAFPLGVGIDEDPASGAANAAIAAFLEEAGALRELGTRYRVSQGREIGHDAVLELGIDAQREVWVGGRTQPVIRGTMDW